MSSSNQETPPSFFAQAYARGGFAVFPVYEVRDGKCACENPNCNSPGKHPRARNGSKDATTDPTQIERWWSLWPDANIGIATGTDRRLIVVDVDGPQGEAELQALQTEHGPLPETASVRTSRGRHIYLSTPKGCVTVRNSTGKGLDIRGEGGFVVAPFSRHISGHVYEWVDDRTRLAEAPPRFLDWTRNRNGIARPIGDKMAGLGELPAHLKNRTNLDPPISVRLDKSLTPVWLPAEQARLESALEAIDLKTCGYDDFLKIGFALHSLNWDRPDGTSVGFDLWDRWCSKSEHYNLAGLEDKWKSFGRSTRAGVTIGTVLHMARERGWSGHSLVQMDRQPSAPIFQSYPQTLSAATAFALKWHGEEDPCSPSALMRQSEGLHERRISGSS
jgi:hypothetical protein